MKQYLWMIRAIHARSDGSRFVDDVAQCGGKNPPTLGLVKIVDQGGAWEGGRTILRDMGTPRSTPTRISSVLEVDLICRTTCWPTCGPKKPYLRPEDSSKDNVRLGLHANVYAAHRSKESRILLLIFRHRSEDRRILFVICRDWFPCWTNLGNPSPLAI
jgi:hypothetical protein